MKTKCLIVDDEPLAIEVIESHLSQFDNFEVVAKCRNAVQAFEVLENENIDLMFLDIQMPKLTGIDFLKTIKNPPKVIFTTAYVDYAIEGYELDVIDYLVKPISFKRFMKAINKYSVTAKDINHTRILNVQNSTENDFVFVKSERKNQKIHFVEIKYIESIKDYIKIHTKNGRIIAKKTLIAFEKELPAQQFIRIHRSYIVNLDFVTAYTAHDIEIDSIEIPIGISYKQRVFERFS